MPVPSKVEGPVLSKVQGRNRAPSPLAACARGGQPRVTVRRTSSVTYRDLRHLAGEGPPRFHVTLVPVVPLVPLHPLLRIRETRGFAPSRRRFWCDPRVTFRRNPGSPLTDVSGPPSPAPPPIPPRGPGLPTGGTGG
jgi:hypothetical protein